MGKYISRQINYADQNQLCGRIGWLLRGNAGKLVGKVPCEIRNCPSKMVFPQS